MNYQETIDYLYRMLPMYQRVGASAFKKDLSNTLALCEHLGAPQSAYPSIHIAGTNGKGSTAHMIAAILQAQGKKVGLYTSPHYRDFRERIKINGEYITETAVIDFVEKHRSFVETLRPSYFEITVAMAFDYFRNEQVDIAVIETGLGGRLDSTNVITPILSVITNISFDHMGLLGDTLPLIAAEKAGIIKDAVPVIVGETQAEVIAVFEEKAKAVNAPLLFADQTYTARLESENFRESIYTIKNNSTGFVFNHLKLGLFGNYQSKNILNALATADILNRVYDFKIEEKHIRAGFENIKTLTNIIGRWEILNEKPLILADSGHNEDGIKEAMRQLQQIPFERLHIVMGMVNDKDLTKVLPLFPKEATYYFAKPNIPRGLEASALRAAAEAYGLIGLDYSTIPAALAVAQLNAHLGDLVFVGGSTFTVAEVV